MLNFRFSILFLTFEILYIYSCQILDFWFEEGQILDFWFEEGQIIDFWFVEGFILDPDTPSINRDGIVYVTLYIKYTVSFCEFR